MWNEICLSLSMVPKNLVNSVHKSSKVADIQKGLFLKKAMETG